ncbi:TraU-like protein [Escherichia coli]|nr:TraU-like protein [Escherichia coli]
MGSCAAPSAKGDDKFITTDYLQQCPKNNLNEWKGLPLDMRLINSCAIMG